jgi:hypothetical protein
MSGVHDLRGEAGNRQRIPDSFPAFPPEAEHNTFNRICMLSEATSHAGAFTRDDLQVLLDGVACAFVDQTTAQVKAPLRCELCHTAWPAAVMHRRVRLSAVSGPSDGLTRSIRG